MADTIQQTLMLRLVFTRALPVDVVVLGRVLFLAFRIVKFVNRFQTLHGPVRKLPGFTPTDIHGLGADNHHYQVDSVVAQRGGQARTSSWSDSGLYSINSPLAKHQVCVVPLVSLLISIRVLLYYMGFCSNYFFEFRQFHRLSR